MYEQSRLDFLKKRKQHCCCKYCGSGLEVRRMTFGMDDDARVELYCLNCKKIEYGVEQEIYAVSEYFVEEMGFQIYTEVDNPVLQKQMNVAKVADIISWGFEQLGYFDGQGFRYPVDTKDALLHEYLNIKLKDLQTINGDDSE